MMFGDSEDDGIEPRGSRNTNNVLERMAETRRIISYLPYRACAILGIPRRGEARVEVSCFGITRGFLSFQVQQE
jgi:hypothetical protein